MPAVDDIRQAARMLRREPGFAAAAIVMLALGIGATTAIFSVVHAVLLKPLPYREPSALVKIVHDTGGIEQHYFSDAIYVTYLEHGRAFDGVGVWSSGNATISGHGDPEEVRALRVSHGFLPTLGVQPHIGRWFSPVDDTRGSADTVMLTHGYWHRRFGADPGVLNRMLTIDARPHHIIGVMPASFTFGGERDVMLPLRIDRTRLIPAFRLLGLARMKPGVTLEHANADVARILDTWVANFRVGRRIRYGPALRSLEQDIVGNIGTTLWILLATVAVVLLMACANVANLLLVRADSRRGEFAIRAALGARWTRVARAVLVESLALTLLGGLLGLGLAYGGVRLLAAIGPANLPRLAEIAIDPVVLGFALALSLLCGMLFAVMPILKYAGPRLAASIGAGSRGSSVTRERQRSQQLLVALQMALALVLLVTAGLMIRSFQALRRVEPGFADPARVQTFSISIPPLVVPEAERVTRMQQQILDKIGAIPGVASAAFTTRLPTDADRFSAALRAMDIADDGRTPPNRHVKIVSPGAFATFGTPLVGGRDFTWTDVSDAREIAIVSEKLAREMWGSAEAALGKRIREYYGSGGPWREIVGVAGDVHDDGAHQQPPATVYWPAREHIQLFGMSGYQPRRVSIVVRSDRAGTESFLTELRAAVWSVNATLPLADVRTLDEIYGRSMARTSFTLVLLVIAGTMALFLGLVGIYGIVSYAVSQRRREIGIRVALGAQAREIRRLFFGRSLVLIGIGIAIGLASAAGLGRVMRSMLFGVEPLDPVVFTVMPVVLAAAAAVATYLPARRALAVDPIETLRAE